jgi:hypothetical protein
MTPRRSTVPSQCACERATTALAVIAYEMRTGAQPYAGATAGECQSRVLTSRFTPLNQHLPEAPARWQEFFVGAFAPDRARRPGSSREFVTQLEQALL